MKFNEVPAAEMASTASVLPTGLQVSYHHPNLQALQSASGLTANTGAQGSHMTTNGEEKCCLSTVLYAQEHPRSPALTTTTALSPCSWATEPSHAHPHPASAPGLIGLTVRNLKHKGGAQELAGTQRQIPSAHQKSLTEYLL